MCDVGNGILRRGNELGRVAAESMQQAVQRTEEPLKLAVSYRLGLKLALQRSILLIRARQIGERAAKLLFPHSFIYFV